MNNERYKQLMNDVGLPKCAIEGDASHTPICIQRAARLP